MAITKVSICNRALYLIGAERISAVTENNKRAVICNDLFDNLRDEVLEAHPWNFASTRDSIAADVTAPEWGFARRYPLPADFLRILKIENSESEYKIEDGYILTDDSSPLNILYIYQQTDTSKFSRLFASALSFRLAAELAYAISQSNTLQKVMFDGYDAILRQARTADAQQGTPDDAESNTWLNSRF